MKKVVLLGSFAPSLVNFHGPLIAAMRDRGQRVIAAAGEMDDMTRSQIRELGAEPESLATDRTGMNPLRDLLYARELVQLFRRELPDLLIAYTAKPVVWGAFAASWAGVPKVVAIITGLGYPFINGGELRRRAARATLTRLYRSALRRCDGVVFQNPDDHDLFRALKLVSERNRCAVVNGDGVDIDHFSPVPVPERPSFLLIARLLGDKGVREYCASALMLKKRYRDVPFRLVGWIDTSPDAIASSELEKWRAGGIEYLGRVEDVRPAIAKCSVYVLPSYREGTPRSVLEAMAMGRAIITTDAPGCRETVVDGENGLIVPVRDVDALAAAMERFIQDPASAKVMGARSRAVAERRYDVRVVTAELMQHAGLA